MNSHNVTHGKTVIPHKGKTQRRKEGEGTRQDMSVCAHVRTYVDLLRVST